MKTFTARGFGMYADFQYSDYRGEPVRKFTVQESSLATERRVWIGADTERAHVTVEEAIIIRDALTEFIEESQ